MASNAFYDFRAKLLRLGTLLGCVLYWGTSMTLAEQPWVYFGTYTGKSSKGIYVSRFNPKTGALATPELAADSQHPSYLALHPKGKFLYAVNEISDFQGKQEGAVTAFALNRTNGHLTYINQQSSGGGAPCHLSVDALGRAVMVANYSGGSIASLPIAADGALKPAVTFIQHTGKGAIAGRQSSPHAHAIYLDKEQRFAVVSDLGLDRVLIYRFNALTGGLTLNEAPLAKLAPASGPRHFAFHPNQRFGFSLNEIDSTITSLSYDRHVGQLTALGTVSTLPANLKVDSSTAEIFIHPSGQFLYASNRGHDSIAAFRVDGHTGSLTLLQNEPTGGQTPRGFGIDPSGRWLLAANQNSDSVVVFSIDRHSGKLTRTEHSISVGSPVSVHFMQP